MNRSATRNLVVGLGILLFALDLAQDVLFVQGSVAVNGWTGRLLGELASLTVRNLLLFIGLLLVLLRKPAGWTVLALLAVFTLIRRCLWFVASATAFDSLSSPAFQGAFSAADLLFRLLCLTVLVDIVRGARDRGMAATRRMQLGSEPFDAADPDSSVGPDD